MHTGFKHILRIGKTWCQGTGKLIVSNPCFVLVIVVVAVAVIVAKTDFLMHNY